MHRFPAATPITTVLDIPVGHVRFIAADRSDATVEVLPADPDKGRGVKAAAETTVDYTDGVLRIQNPTRAASPRTPGAVEVTVQLPTGSHVEAKTASAEIRGVGRLGDLAFEGAHGAVRIDEAASGPLELRTAKGDISVDIAAGVSATLDASTSFGRIHNALRNTEGAAVLTVHATTAYGGITARSL